MYRLIDFSRMQKMYDIQLSGTLMTGEKFTELAENHMLGGIKHRYNARTIEYEMGTYFNAKEDMRAFKSYCEQQGYKVICSEHNRKMSTQGGELVATLRDYISMSI